MQHVNIIGTGKALPKNEVIASRIDKKYNFEEGKTFKVTGLEKRYFLENEPVNDLMLRAINQALENAKLTVDDINCIISANATMQQMIPYNGAGVHGLLKPKRNIS